MDIISSDIILNLIFPLLPLFMLVALQHTSKKYHRLVLNYYPNNSRNHLKLLGEVCEGGYVNLLGWFLGRGESDLGWSLLISGVQDLLSNGEL